MKRVVVVVALLALIGCGSGDRASRTVLQNKGSDTLVNVAQAWAEAYQKAHPGIVVAVNGGYDADTVGAMAGALAGAYLGIDAIPDRWADRVIPPSFRNITSKV